jgi:CRP-like cAMP-binding protein
MASSGAAERRADVPPEWDRLELTVRRLMDDHDAWRRRAEAAERRVRELEAALAQVASGQLDPLALSERASTVERENRELAERLGRARETVQRIMARLHFAEDDR